LNYVLFGVRHQNVVVNVLFTEFVFDDGDFVAMVFA
jgi:hypothetical protein